MKKIIIILFALVLAPVIANASGCYNDPIYERDWHGKYNISAYVRNNPCMDGTSIIETVTANTVVQVIGETDGWYKVITPTGQTGWTGSSLMTITTEAITETNTGTTGNQTKTQTQNKIAERLQGKILLQVQANGEAWYIYPENKKRYYLGRPADAFAIMRELGLGIKHSELAGYLNTNFPSRLSGQIMLDVEANGEAYYIYPDDLKGYYLGRPADAFAIMRELGLGITNNDLEQITVSSDDISVSDSLLSTNIHTTKNQYDESYASSFQRGVVPAGIDLNELNKYWLNKVNQLRSASGLRQLVLDSRFVDTATEWAGYMGEDLGYSTHTRPDGKSMHQWIDQKNLDWTERYSQDGWQTNYFTENIAWEIVSGTTDSAKAALDRTMDWILAESSYNGSHYRTVYHQDWNCLGLGFFFLPSGNNYKIFIAMHYGSLVQ